MNIYKKYSFYLYPLVSGLLGFCSFPGLNQGWMAWFMIVPLLVFADHVKSLKGFLVGGFVAEFVKWFSILVWLRHVTWVGLVSICCLMAFYQLIWFYVFWFGRKILNKGFCVRLLFVFSMSMFWVWLEWIRTFPLGIPGAHLSITQWLYPAVLSVCTWGGGYLLSGLIVLVNLVFWDFYYSCSGTLILRKSFVRLFSVLIFVIAVIGLSNYVVQKKYDNTKSIDLRVAVVQPNQPPYLYWTRERIVRTIEDLFNLSRSVKDQPFDIMVWPEGALPYAVCKGNEMDEEVRRLILQDVRRPILWGNQGLLNSNTGEQAYYNGVFFHDQFGVMSEKSYAKRVLVPFGEYIPFRKFLKGLETIVPIPSDLNAGRDPVGFDIQTSDGCVNISPLVCYEDCFTELAVENARSGADLLYVATYDVWYGREFGAYMHAAHSVMRAVENHRPVLRCGSAGWSGYINADGRILSAVKDDQGSVYFKGSEVLSISVPLSAKLSFYTQYYEFVIVAINLLLLLSVGLIYVTSKSKNL